MMKSKLSLRNLAKAGLKIIPLILFLSACSSSTAPSFLKEDIPQVIKDICKKEYQLDTSTKLTGRTLWVYLPLENMVSKPLKPEKSIERFLLEDKNNSLEEGIWKINYSVKLTEEKEKLQEMALDKSVTEKIFGKILPVIRRVLFSIDNSKKDNPLFFCIVAADIKNGFELKYTFYALDLKKFSYGLISQAEYQHRIIQNMAVSVSIIDDRDGHHLQYQDITLKDFIAGQIRGRIGIKFQKPEVERNADIDKEVLKIVSYTLNIYEFKDFTAVEMSNLISGSKIILNQKAALTDSRE